MQPANNLLGGQTQAWKKYVADGDRLIRRNLQDHANFVLKQTRLLAALNDIVTEQLSTPPRIMEMVMYTDMDLDATPLQLDARFPDLMRLKERLFIAVDPTQLGAWIVLSRMRTLGVPLEIIADFPHGKGLFAQAATAEYHATVASIGPHGLLQGGRDFRPILWLNMEEHVFLRSRDSGGLPPGYWRPLAETTTHVAIIGDSKRENTNIHPVREVEELYDTALRPNERLVVWPPLDAELLSRSLGLERVTRSARFLDLHPIALSFHTSFHEEPERRRVMKQFVQLISWQWCQIMHPGNRERVFNESRQRLPKLWSQQSSDGDVKVSSAHVPKTVSKPTVRQWAILEALRESDLLLTDQIASICKQRNVHYRCLNVALRTYQLEIETMQEKGWVEFEGKTKGRLVTITPAGESAIAPRRQ